MDIVLKYEGVWQVLFSAELFRKNTVIFPEISGKFRWKFPEISELTTLLKVIETGTNQQIGYVFLLVIFVPKTHRFWDIHLRKIPWSWNLDWRSLEVTVFHTSPMTSYWRSIVTMALRYAFLRYSMSKYIATLMYRSRVKQGYWK